MQRQPIAGLSAGQSTGLIAFPEAGDYVRAIRKNEETQGHCFPGRPLAMAEFRCQLHNCESENRDRETGTSIGKVVVAAVDGSYTDECCNHVKKPADPFSARKSEA